MMTAAARSGWVSLTLQVEPGATVEFSAAPAPFDSARARRPQSRSESLSPSHPGWHTDCHGHFHCDSQWPGARHRAKDSQPFRLSTVAVTVTVTITVT